MGIEMAKGITDIIAIILLLMITISLVGFAWMWLQRTAKDSWEPVAWKNITVNECLLWSSEVSADAQDELLNQYGMTLGDSNGVKTCLQWFAYNKTVATMEGKACLHEPKNLCAVYACAVGGTCGCISDYDYLKDHGLLCEEYRVVEE